MQKLLDMYSIPGIHMKDIPVLRTWLYAGLMKYVKYADFCTFLCVCLWHHACRVDSPTSALICSATLQ